MTKKNRGVYERKPGSGIWYIRFRDRNGKLYRQKVGAKSMAERAYQRQRVAIAEDRFEPERVLRRTLKFGDLIDTAVEYSKNHNRHGSYLADKWHAEIVREWFGKKRPAEISAADIDRKLDKLCAAGKAPATRNRYRSFLSRVFSLAVRNGKLRFNPVIRVDKLKEHNERMRVLSAAEETALRAAIRTLHPEREPELDLDLATGLRRSELYGLEWGDIDLEVGLATVRDTKGGGERHVELNRPAVDALRCLKKIGGDRKKVCAGGHSQRTWFRQCTIAAGVRNFVFHDLRHTFASRVVRAGVSLYVLKELLGHKTLVMSQRYAHLDRPQLRDAVKRIEGLQPSIPPGIPSDLGENPAGAGKRYVQ